MFGFNKNNAQPAAPRSFRGNPSGSDDNILRLAASTALRNIFVTATGNEIKRKKFTLCPTCTACPEVEITDQGVTIGEAANTVRQRTCVAGEKRRTARGGGGSRSSFPLGWEHINLTGDYVWSPAGEMTERTERVPGCERRDASRQAEMRGSSVVRH